MKKINPETKSTIFFIINTLFDAILAVCILVMLLLVISGFYQKYFAKNSYTGLFQIGYAVVVSGSMEPYFQVGDMIIYQAHDAKDYHVNDVIVYVRDRGTSQEMLITHRIVEVDNYHHTVTTKGDVNYVNDDPISKDDIIGRIALRVPSAGKIIDFAKSTKGIMILLAGFLLVAVIDYLMHQKKTVLIRTVFGKRKITF